MSTSEFDKQLQEQYEQGGFEYNSASWEHMLQQLDTVQPAKKKSFFAWLSYTGVAATLALIAGMSYFFILKQQTVKTSDVSPGHTVSSTPAKQAEEPAASPERIADAPAAIVPQPVIRRSAQQAVAQQASGSMPRPVQTNENVAGQEDRPATADHRPVVTISTPEKKKSFGTAVPLPDDLFMNPKEKEERKTSLSLAGGVNYGSLNTGYALAVNARRKIGSKFYVEGDLAYVSSNPQNATSINEAQFDKVVAQNGNTAYAIAAAPGTTSVNTLSYLQFTPTVGYHIKKRFTVGMGADLQRRLQNTSDKTVIDENGTAKMLPDVDFGVVAKTEYALTPRLKTGIMYREGLNGLGDSKYLNRRYVQMQLKWRLFEK